MLYWNLNKYINNINKLKFRDHLKEIEDIVDFLFVLKYSNVFTGKTASIETKENICSLMYNKFYSRFPEEIDTFVKDVKILNEMYDELISKKKRSFSLIDKQKVPIFLLNTLNSIINDTSKESSTLNIDKREQSILLIGKILKDLLREKVEFTYVNTNEFASEDILSAYVNIDFFSNVIVDSWKYSRLSIKKDKIVYFKESGDFSKEKLYSQATFLELKTVRDFKGAFLASACKSNEVFYEQKKQYIHKQIEEYFYTNDFEQEYLGVSLKDWIKGYEVLYDLSVKSKNDKILLTEDTLKNIYKSSITNESSINIILKHLTFTTSSRDLYDSPLIKFGEEYLIHCRLIKAIDYSRSIISVLSHEQSRTDTGISQKGKNFEKYINNLVNKVFKKNSSGLKVEENGNTFEIDGLFYDRGVVVILEMKTQRQPENYIDFYKNQVELEKYIDKFNRNSNFFIENPEYIIDNLNLDAKEELTFRKIFVTNVSQKRTTYKGVYIIDEIDFYNFMNRQSPTIKCINNSEKKVVSMEIDSELYTGEPSVGQLIKLIENPFKRERVMKKIITRKIDFLGKETVEMFVLDDFIKNI